MQTCAEKPYHPLNSSVKTVTAVLQSLCAGRTLLKWPEKAILHNEQEAHRLENRAKYSTVQMPNKISRLPGQRAISVSVIKNADAVIFSASCVLPGFHALPADARLTQKAHERWGSVRSCPASLQQNPYLLQMS
jgi:hypothetical protein